jgi:large subunit ribosomal protein L21
LQIVRWLRSCCTENKKPTKRPDEGGSVTAWAAQDRWSRVNAPYGCERKNMYAVIKTGGKQYKVAAGEKIKVELLDAEVGAEVTIDQVLAIGSGDGLTVGAPLVAGATVSAKVVSHGKHDKVRIFKMRRRKHYKKSQGHRQNYTELEISAVNG